jgi:hypothetical protein
MGNNPYFVRHYNDLVEHVGWMAASAAGHKELVGEADRVL